MPLRLRLPTVGPFRRPRHASAVVAAVLVVLLPPLIAPPLLSQATAVRVSSGADEGLGPSPRPPIAQQPSGPSAYGPPEAVRQRDAQLEAAVPPQYAPPGGMCRVWVHGVPPAQQPAPTQCAKAVRVRSPNSQVVFGTSRRGALASASAPATGVGAIGGDHPLVQGGTGTGGGASGRRVVTDQTTLSSGSSGGRGTTTGSNGPRPPPPATHHNPPAPHVSVRAH
jgi:hypothetical protein